VAKPVVGKPPDEITGRSDMRRILVAAILVIWLILSAGVTFSATDYVCLGECKNRGFSQEYCVRVCSY
jgi:hypothetical protein